VRDTPETMVMHFRPDEPMHNRGRAPAQPNRSPYAGRLTESADHLRMGTSSCTDQDLICPLTRLGNSVLGWFGPP